MDNNDRPPEIQTNNTTTTPPPDNKPPTSEPASGASRFHPKNMSRRTWIIVIALLGLVAVAVLLYNLWYQNPNKVVSDGIMHAIKAKTVTYTGKIAVDGESNFNIAINGKGTSDKGTLNAVLSFDVDDKTYELEGNTIASYDGNWYFKVKNIDELVKNYRATVPPPSQDLFDKIIDKIDDKWIKINAEDLKSYSPDAAQAQRCMNDAFKKFQDEDKLEQELISLYKQYQFIVIDEKLGSREGSIGYVLATNPDTAKEFAKGLRETSLYKTLHDCDASFTIKDSDLTKQSDSSDDNGKVELWVSRWSHRVTKVAVTTDSKQGAVNVVVEPTFNKNVTITTPKDTTTLKKLQADVQKLLQSAAPQSTAR
ncbi:MAG TPA: hypothetical protein VFM68_01830 [Candidatus Saccharimonadales bacterium]|nr:hypothetical protein [Candidatus Saccharimonadales bacterium]